ncbi:MAG: hypothetical protein JO073_12020 [Actinobacteria bacterium]|nr:hypothetical protein [Actinomycetota bacterium]
MSSLSPIGYQTPSETTGVTPTTMASPPPAPYLQGTLDGVASLLSMSTDSLRSALKSGQSISDLAQQKGVSRDSIVQYIEQQVQQQRAADGQSPVPQDALDQVVNRAVDRHRGAHRHHHAAPPPDPTQLLDSGSPRGIDQLA